MKEYHKNITDSEGSLSKMMMMLLSKQYEKNQSKSKSDQKGKSTSSESNSSQSLSEKCIHYIRKEYDESKYWIKHPELHPMKKGNKKPAINMMTISRNSSIKI